MIRREFTPEQKQALVLTLLSGRTTVAELCREHQVSTSVLYRWRDQFLDGGMRALQGQTSTKREDALRDEVEHLKRSIGELALANQALKKVRPGRRGGWP